MRKAWQLAAVAVLCVFLASPAGAAEKIYINGIDANFPPFAYVDKKGVPDGFDIKALDWIARDQGFKVKHQPQDWDASSPASWPGRSTSSPPG